MTRQNDGKTSNKKQGKGASIRITGEDAKLLKALERDEGAERGTLERPPQAKNRFSMRK